MCGIIAEVAGNSIDVTEFNKLRDLQRHRGPDGAGTYVNDDGNVALGSRRLSIIDTSSNGDMPLSNETGDIWIVYNGELYNYESVRQTLVERGHTFDSETDTETIVHAYEEWGVDCVERFRGMFAFALWDEQSERLFCARDRLGIKPFYYHASDDRILIASELKSIISDSSVRRQVDPDAVAHFLTYRYIPAPLSIWEGIAKLPPGHTLVYDGDELSIDAYWDLDAAIETKRNENETEALSKIEDLLSESTTEHLVSDVPLSVLLSGGIDSSVVTALVADDLDGTNTYSVGFEGETDELPFARTVAEAYDTEHTEKILSRTDLDELAEELMYYYDEPLGDSSIFPTYILMEAISEDYKVALSGDGGDEVFAGYNWYTRYRRYQQFDALSDVFSLGDRLLDAIPDRFDNRFFDAVKSRLEPFSRSGLDRYRQIMAPRFERDDVERLLSDEARSDLSDEDVLENKAGEFEDVTDLQAFDAQSFLVDDILVKVDRASMAHSLEVRVPYLDHRLVEYVLSLDADVVFPDGEQKHLLKTLARQLLPDSILDREKQGFSAPLDEMEFIEEYQNMLYDSQAAEAGIFDQDALDDQVQTATDSARDQAQLWLLIAFELWFREWGEVNNT